MVAIAALCSRNKTDSRSDHSPHLSATAVLLTGAVAGLTAAFLIEPKLGMARDWDMMSVYLIGAGLTGIYMWCRNFAGQVGFKTATAGLLVAQLSTLVPWVTINNSPSALYDYTIDVMELDPKHSRAGFFRMKAYNDGNNHPVEAARLDMYNRDMFPEMWLNREGLNLMVDNRCKSALTKLDSAVTFNPVFFSPYLNRGLIHTKFGRYEQAHENYDIADGLNPYNVYIHTFRGRARYYEGDTAAAVMEWREGLDYDARNPLPYLYLANWHVASDRPDSALAYLKRYPGTDYVYSYYFILGTRNLIVEDSVTVFDGLLNDIEESGDTPGINMVSEVIDHILRAQYPEP
jgi:hypothetical protein